MATQNPGKVDELLCEQSFPELDNNMPIPRAGIYSALKDTSASTPEVTIATTVDAQSADESASTGFLSLSAELRNNIYELVYDVKRHLVVCFEDNFHMQNKTWSLLATCKLINKEASSIRYYNRKYHISLFELQPFCANRPTVVNSLHYLSIKDDHRCKDTMDGLGYLEVLPAFQSLHTLKLHFVTRKFDAPPGYKLWYAKEIFPLVRRILETRKMSDLGGDLSEILEIKLSNVVEKCMGGVGKWMHTQPHLPWAVEEKGRYVEELMAILARMLREGKE